MLFFNAPFKSGSTILDDSTLCEITNVCNTEKEVSINCICDYDHYKDFDVHYVRQDYYLIYALDGELNIEFDNAISKLTKGSLLIMRPQTHYYYYTTDDNFISYVALHITGSKAEEFIKEFDLPLNEICNCGYIDNILNYWKRLQREFIIRDKFFDRTSVALLTQILARFSRALNSTDANNYLARSVSYIHENFNKKISTKYLAELEEMSESYYRMIFKQLFGKTPIEHITTLRNSATAEYLESTNKSLDEIASLVGYSDGFYLGKMFKKEFGVSPGKYRKSSKKYKGDSVQ